jgi:hypothetical protein
MPRKAKTSRGDKLADQIAKWDQTPFHPHARLRGIGADCKGSLWGACDELGFPEAKSEYATTLDYNLTRANGIPTDKLREGFAALFDRVTDEKRGDILLCKHGGVPAHIAVDAGNGRAWSALPASGMRCRKQSTLFHHFPLDSRWRLRER